MECQHTYAACVTAPWPTAASPHCPPSGLRLWGQKQLAWPLSRWRAGAYFFFSLTLQNTHTLKYKCTLPRCFFCILSFNQALSRASVTSLSTQCVKDLSPPVTSLTDLLTDRPLAHLAADVTAVSTAGSPPYKSEILVGFFRSYFCGDSCQQQSKG